MWDQLRAPLAPLEPSQHYHIAGLKGGLVQIYQNILPLFREKPVSRTANAVFHSAVCSERVALQHRAKYCARWRQLIIGLCAQKSSTKNRTPLTSFFFLLCLSSLGVFDEDSLLFLSRVGLLGMCWEIVRICSWDRRHLTSSIGKISLSFAMFWLYLR